MNSLFDHDNFIGIEPTIFDRIDNSFNVIAAAKDVSVLEEFIKFLHIWEGKELSPVEKKWYDSFLKIITDPGICILAGSAPLNHDIKDKTGAIIEATDFDFFIDANSIHKIINILEVEAAFKERYPEVLEQSYKIPSYYRHEQAFGDILNNYLFNKRFLNKLYYTYLMSNQDYFEILGITGSITPEDIISEKSTFSPVSVSKTSSINEYSNEYSALISKDMDILTFRLTQQYIPINIIIPVLDIKTVLPREFMSLAPEPITPIFFKNHIYNVAEKFDFENAKVYYNFQAKKVDSVYSLYIDNLVEIYDEFNKNKKTFQEMYPGVQSYMLHRIKANLKLKENKCQKYLEEYNQTVKENPLSLKLSFNEKSSIELLFSKFREASYLYDVSQKNKEMSVSKESMIHNRLFSLTTFYPISLFITETWPRILKYTKRGFEFDDDYGILDVIHLYFEIMPHAINNDKYMNLIRRKNVLRQSKNTILSRDIKRKFSKTSL